MDACPDSTANNTGDGNDGRKEDMELVLSGTQNDPKSDFDMKSV